MKNWFRALVAVWYLLGWILHLYLGIVNPEVYRSFSDTALIPGFEIFWDSFVMPNITILVLLLAVFEIAVGLLLINKRKWVHLGLILSMGFNLFLVQLGLSIPAEDLSMDLYFNRFPNIIFILLQIWLLFQSYPNTLLEAFRERSESQER
ncbi:MAG: hypothetical protein WBB69_13395 [Anaerolineales bacterium]